MILTKRKNITDWLSVVLMLILLLSTALMLFVNVVQNYVDVNSVFGSDKNKKIYILESSNTKNRLKAIGVGSENYINTMKEIKSTLQKRGFSVRIIDEMGLNSLTNKDILLVIDAISISKFAQQKIISFVKDGGSLLFNFDSGFIDEKGNFTETKMIETITSLKKEGYVKRDKEHSFYLAPKLLAPITIKGGKRLEMQLYDQIPIFSGKESYLKFTNWPMNEPMKQGNKFLPSGALWSGHYGKGGWVYFSFPFYAMQSVKEDISLFNELFNNMIDYLYKGVKAVAYPYIHYDKVVFVSEDTEYKFSNFKGFIDLAKKYDFNVTAFCVGRLAEKNASLMKEAGSLKNVEIASHSYSHTKLIDDSNEQLKVEIDLNKKLLEKLTNRTVIGFRPPREEINMKMYKRLAKTHYIYVMQKNLGSTDVGLEDNLINISRSGTDDYEYLINLDWDKEQILKKIEQEAKFITSSNAIYALSIHTHLMAYKSNISILENAFKFFKKEKYILLKGKDIAFLVMQRKNIDIKVTQTETNYIVHIKNKNYEDVKNLNIRIFLSKNVNITGVLAEFSTIKAKIIKYPNKDYVDININKLRRTTDYDLFLSYE